MIERITSKQNEWIKRAASLRDRKYRALYGAYLVEGQRAVRDTMAGGGPVKLFLSQAFIDKNPDAFADVDFAVTAAEAFDKLTDTDAPQGVAAIFEIPKPERLYQSAYCLFLENVRDPGNLGTILRTALAAGFFEVYLCGCCDAFNPKSVRSAVSAVAKLKIYEAQRAELDKLKGLGYTLVCGDMCGENVFKAAFPAKKYCLMIGSEADGLSDEARRLADLTIGIPMRGDIESLNAAVSAGILLYQIARGSE
ncbi:MAG: RNA methyltransferase [Clostridiales bacterium]|jgi:TrmH family RNA methyltransferase|nr:RNA methyltransferase [Clostridiales bacterium]